MTKNALRVTPQASSIVIQAMTVLCARRQIPHSSVCFYEKVDHLYQGQSVIFWVITSINISYRHFESRPDCDHIVNLREIVLWFTVVFMIVFKDFRTHYVNIVYMFPDAQDLNESSEDLTLEIL